ncbi:MAG: hypothetical protein HOE48_06215 [Candidatus Latescibacteria bacterium]|jgi:hypothetical protein|nr:hypothetical protein [Candidatus Latescibacterota bacterium]
MYTYESVLQSQTKRVKAALARQILDSNDPAFGAFLSERSGAHPNADHGCNASDLASACYVFLAEGSNLENNDELFDRIQKSIAFQRKWQRPTGLIDLVSVNWESPPDTGFTVQLLSPVVEVARQKAQTGNKRAQEIADTLGEYVRTAAAGMIDRGFHTPNHRWVVCSGLSQALLLFPELPARDYVDRILAETIDINADGEYTERSTGVYNAVCDRSLRFMADSLNKPELLDAVRKNLDIMAHLFHEDGTVVTSISNRQDRGLRVVPVGIADSFFDMAQRDQNGVWAQVADSLASQGTDQAHSPWLLQPFMQNPNYRKDTLTRSPLPNNYTRHYPISGLWRVKRGPLSATAATGNRTALSVRYGNINLRAIKFSGTYMSTSNLQADKMEAIENGIRLTQKGADHRAPGYDLPLNKEVPMGQFGAVRSTRERWTCPEMDLRLDIVEVENGFNLQYKTDGGLDRVPIEIECTFEGPGEWETHDNVLQVENGQSAILKSGYGTFHNGNEGIAIGPGSGIHRDWNMRGSDPDNDSFRVLITLQTPVDFTFEIRYGTWSLASKQLI